MSKEPENAAPAAPGGTAPGTVPGGTARGAGPGGTARGTAPAGRAQGAGGLIVDESHLDAMVAHCLAAYPEEGCGLLVGRFGTGAAAAGEVTRVYPTRNLQASAQVYTVDPREHLRADREAEAEGASIIGVFHSHTHTDAYPSPTDVAQAVDPAWHYVVISLRHELASTRCFRIEDGNIFEQTIVVRR